MPPTAMSNCVLIVDDHEVIRELLARNLQTHAFQVVTAANGVEALATLRATTIDLVLLDVMMPEMSGTEVLQRMKADPDLRDIPVIMVSADTDTNRIVACINLGAEDYVTKPFNPVILKARVNACLERRRLRLRDQAYQALLEDRVVERTALAEQRAADLERSEAALRRSEAALRRQSTILQSILHSMADGVVVTDTQGQLIHCNPAAERIFGAQLPALLAQVQGGAPAGDELALGRAIRGDAVDGVEISLGAEGARRQWLSVTARPLREQVGPPLGGVAVVRDVSDAKAAELALRESEERYALAARGANDGLWDWSLATGMIYFSARWKAMLGYPEEEIGTTLDEWLDRVHPEDRERLEARLAAHLRRLISHFEHEYRVLHRDGSYRWMLCRGLAVWDETGRAMRMAGSQTDITDRKRAEQQLLHDALHDGLTGLPNRVLLTDRLEHAIARVRRSPAYQFAVLFLDLDRFKVVNDSLGHTTGDQLLISIARRLEECVRPGDTVARLGGDEFVVLLEEAEGKDAVLELADRLQAHLSAPIQLGDQVIFSTVSIGILLSAPDDRTAAQLLRDADTAMYQAKSRGKACAIVFDPAMHAQAILQLQLESDLRGALERDEFRVYYQPIVSLEDGIIVGFEALIRWQHPHRGLLAPAEFLAIAEETGLIGPISWWVLRTACAQVCRWNAAYPDSQQLWVSVNLAAKQLTQPNMVAQVGAVLDETGMPPQRLKLEITEHTLIEYGDLTIDLLSQLHRIGVQLCIDDFGTGYSSLSYLQRFPVNVLKIDRSFISHLGEPGKRSEIVQTIVSLARTLGMQAVAEGTETLQQAHELRRLACDYGQGWLFSKALDAEAVEALVSGGRSLLSGASLVHPTHEPSLLA